MIVGYCNSPYVPPNDDTDKNAFKAELERSLNCDQWRSRLRQRNILNAAEGTALGTRELLCDRMLQECPFW